ncbi:acetate uptake transporter [Streptomyces sp. URMC 123]|uniref:acetate uptake transporter n=1 Tax=Streptomyces sp. URMC 123 TaxID=3423403 RepID=UPI003F1D19F3
MDNEVFAGRRAGAAGPGGDASALGLLALGLTLLAFGLFHADVIDGVTAQDASALALFVGGVTLFVAGLWELRGGAVPTGTAFTALGAFWFTWGTGVGEARVSDHAQGLFLLLWALLALSLTLAAWGWGPVARVVFGLLFVALVLLAVARFVDSAEPARIAGWIAVVSGAAAWYGATARLANAGFGRSVLPLGR